ncbi:putative carboxypeptidase C [Helianthus anomalus]
MLVYVKEYDYFCNWIGKLFHAKGSNRAEPGYGLELELELGSKTKRAFLKRAWGRDLFEHLYHAELKKQNRIMFLSELFKMDTDFEHTRNYRWVEAMKWSGRKEFETSRIVKFEVDGKEAGELKNHGPLTFLTVRACEY